MRYDGMDRLLLLLLLLLPVVVLVLVVQGGRIMGRTLEWVGELGGIKIAIMLRIPVKDKRAK